MTVGGEPWVNLLRLCDAAENDPALRPALQGRWPAVERFVVPDDDPRVALRGQFGLRAAQDIEPHTVISPYQVRLLVPNLSRS